MTVMNRAKQTARLLTMIAVVLAGCHNPGTALHNSTEWQIQPSFKYDVLAFLNVLSGDSFYLPYYSSEYAHFEPLLTPAAREALISLKRKIKDEGGGIISAFLALYFSTTDDETLDEMLDTLEDSRTMQENLKATPYYSESGWALYQSVRPELKTILQFLKNIDFPSYWRENVQPRVMEKIAQIEPRLPQYNVIREVERLLRHRLPSSTITVYMLYFSQPHGIKITGTRFLTDIAWPFRIVLRNAVHEMMHPPYDYTEDTALREAIDRLKEDEFLMDKVENHNPAFGYNSFEGFLEEDVVQALEQIIDERLGIARDARKRWRESDEGMHVFAVALYSVMKEQDFGEADEDLRGFLIQQIRLGRLRPGHIQAIYDEFNASMEKN